MCSMIKMGIDDHGYSGGLLEQFDLILAGKMVEQAEA